MKKWEEIDYPHKEIAHELTGALAMSGMQVMDIGMTYLADRLTQDGDIIESALDHIYVSTELANEIGARKSEESSTDHVPIIAELKNEKKTETKTEDHNQKEYEKLHRTKMEGMPSPEELGETSRNRGYRTDDGRSNKIDNRSTG